MSNVRKGLHYIPSHMHMAAIEWAEHAEPHPHHMGGFLYAVLTNDLADAAAHADRENQESLFGWAMFMYNYLPSQAWGSPEKVQRWYDAHHAAETQTEPA